MERPRNIHKARMIGTAALAVASVGLLAAATSELPFSQTNFDKDIFASGALAMGSLMMYPNKDKWDIGAEWLGIGTTLVTLGWGLVGQASGYSGPTEQLFETAGFTLMAAPVFSFVNHAPRRFR